MKHTEIHYLKTLAPYFDAVARKHKTFEIRETGDRGFQPGDIVVLERWEKTNLGLRADPSSKPIAFGIGWMLPGGQFGLEPGYVAFTLEPLDAGVLVQVSATLGRELSHV